MVLLGDGTLRCECKEVKWAKKWQKSVWWRGFSDIWVGNCSECLYILCLVLLGEVWVLGIVWVLGVGVGCECWV